MAKSIKSIIKIDIKWKRKRLKYFLEAIILFLDDSLMIIFSYYILGPNLPVPLSWHSMVPLIHGQALIGGQSTSNVAQNKIYFLTCSNLICTISTLSQELSVPRYWFVAIPIPDSMSGCISGGKNSHFNFNVFLKNDKQF